MGSGLDWGSTDDCILFCCRSKSVTRVVALLKEFGLDIITNSGRGTLVSSSRPLFQESTNRRSWDDRMPWISLSVDVWSKIYRRGSLGSNPLRSLSTWLGRTWIRSDARRAGGWEVGYMVGGLKGCLTRCLSNKLWAKRIGDGSGVSFDSIFMQTVVLFRPM